MWTSEPDRFIVFAIHQMLGLNTWNAHLAVGTAMEEFANTLVSGGRDVTIKCANWSVAPIQGGALNGGETTLSVPNFYPNGWAPTTRYPDPAVQSIDPAFDKYRLPLAGIERLATGMRWAEGPVWFGDARHLLWSDIPNNRIMSWNEETGQVSHFRSPSNFANGHTRDRHGRLVTCEHGGRRITRTEYDGTITTLIDRFEGKRLNSPNDIIVKSDGSVWFSDPTFGILGNYEGYKSEPELGQNVYCLDAETGNATVVANDILGPNGLCFSPDESILYIVESRGVPNRKILAYDVGEDGRTLSNKRVLIDAGAGTPDGMRCDVDGNLWCGWGMGNPNLDGVMVFAPNGKPIGRIALPERCANVCFGGRANSRLFMAASQSVYALYVNVAGVLGG